MWIDVVFSGGGIKGLAFAGALDRLEKSGYRFKRAAGTSAGSIVAALLMAGYTASEMKKLIDEMDTRKLLDAPAYIRFPFYKWLRVYFKMGLYRGDSLEDWLEEALSRKGISVFSDLPQGSLKIIVSDVSKGRLTVIPDDLPDYGINPGSFSIARAVRMSAGLPFFFEPISLFDGNGERSLIVDGGILSNFPIWIFDREDGLPTRPFLGLQTTDGETENRPKIQNAVELFRGIFTAMHEAHDERTIEKLKDSNVIVIPVKSVTTKDFQISSDEKNKLYQIGAKETERFLQKWSY
ncbi:patatin-like phospholipase family protein [Sporolactobacillus pectinivorans]|uniref:patatin-like phospholipase family protein n=1 Tax=Sporolactobacillus pectinivorans TaxID=1591408 RepID=UPI000C25DBD2|nr:patatin-like phospholipase family protein [Sporolactobacillus pectinivorans]